jgi:RIP metalloprotease RseP
MDTLIQIGQIIFILSVLVILHEFGHYLPAKLFKVRVEKFYLFMDPWFSLFKKKIKDTEWGIGWLPIGGYVKLSGMMDESMDSEQMAQPAQPWEFRSKPAWQRLIIMLGGITVNILLAWFIYTVMYSTYGQKYVSTELIQKNGLAFGESGLNAGFKNGDKIVSVDGTFQPKFNRLMIDLLLGDKVEIERNGTKQTLLISDEQKSKILATEGKDFVKYRAQLNDIYIDSIGAASKIKFEKGDFILGFNNTKLVYADELKDSLKNHKNKTVQLLVNRNGQEISLPAAVNKTGDIGISEDFFFSQKTKIEDAVIREVASGSEAEKAKLLPNDQILGLNNKKYTYIHELKYDIAKYKNQNVALAVKRDNKEILVNTKVNHLGRLGVFFSESAKNSAFLITNKLSLFEAIPAAVNESYTQFVYNIKQFKLILRPKTGAYKQVKSPIGITQLLPTTWDWEFVWSFIAMFSIGLAFMNLLPIPGLDGGHAIFTIAEMVTGKTLSVKAAERVQTVGMIILLSLMALTFGKDIYEIIARKFL